jgi:hypothetical protein
VAQLESLLNSLLSENTVNIDPKIRLDIPPSLESWSANFKNAPLLSILEGSPEKTRFNLDPQSNLKYFETRQALLALFPSSLGLEFILKSTSA